MNRKIKKIEILTEQDLDKLIKKHDCDKFSCTCNGCDETNTLLRIAIYSNYDMFDELTEQLSNSDMGFMAFGGIKDNSNYTAIEIVL